MRWSFRQLMRPIAMLLLAVMVFMPVVDAFSCSFEAEPSHAAGFSTDGDRTPHDEDGSDGKNPDEAPHDACVHNHCHHVTADLPPGFVTGALLLKAGGPHPVDDANRLPDMSDGLMRPPRI